MKNKTLCALLVAVPLILGGCDFLEADRRYLEEERKAEEAEKKDKERATHSGPNVIVNCEGTKTYKKIVNIGNFYVPEKCKETLNAGYGPEGVYVVCKNEEGELVIYSFLKDNINESIIKKRDKQ